MWASRSHRLSVRSASYSARTLLNQLPISHRREEGTGMELSISKRDFLRGLARTHAVADRKSSMPILSNVLLSADEAGLLRLLATDLYLAVNASVEASIKRP